MRRLYLSLFASNSSKTVKFARRLTPRYFEQLFLSKMYTYFFIIYRGMSKVHSIFWHTQYSVQKKRVTSRFGAWSKHGQSSYLCATKSSFYNLLFLLRTFSFQSKSYLLKISVCLFVKLNVFPFFSTFRQSMIWPFFNGYFTHQALFWISFGYLSRSVVTFAGLRQMA